MIILTLWFIHPTGSRFQSIQKRGDLTNWQLFHPKKVQLINSSPISEDLTQNPIESPTLIYAKELLPPNGRDINIRDIVWAYTGFIPAYEHQMRNDWHEAQENEPQQLLKLRAADSISSFPFLPLLYFSSASLLKVWMKLLYCLNVWPYYYQLSS